MKQLSVRAQKYMTRSLKILLNHTYTWQAVGTIPVLNEDNEPTLNEWQQPVTQDAYPIPGNPCLYYLWTDNNVNDNEGELLTGTPALYVPPEDQANIGDYVFDVITQNGTIIFTAGIVRTIDPVAMFGNNICKILRLTGTTTV